MKEAEIDLPPQRMNPEPWLARLTAQAERLHPGWVAMRRHLHRHPELSGNEYSTTEFLAAAMREIGLSPHLAGDARGLTTDLVTSPDLAEADRIALRGDIDALPIADQKHVDYHSTQDGVMHACGHDVHATVVCGSLQILTAMHKAGELPWPIAARAIFQPAEEIAEGAQHMIHHHALRDVGGILALHVDPQRSVGTIGLRAGMLTAAADLFHVDFHGKGGHGARPHLCDDPIDAATAWVQTAYRRLARITDPTHTVVISVGRMEAGHSANVIPETVMLEGTLRSLDPAGRQKALDALESINQSITEQTGCRVSLRWIMSAPAVNNDVRLIRLLRETAVRVVDPAAPETIDHPSMGSEDFSYYLDHVPGAMFRLGVAGPQVGHEALHTPLFDVDERCLTIGAKLFAASVIEYFAPSSPQAS